MQTLDSDQELCFFLISQETWQWKCISVPPVSNKKYTFGFCKEKPCTCLEQEIEI